MINSSKFLLAKRFILKLFSGEKFKSIFTKVIDHLIAKFGDPRTQDPGKLLGLAKHLNLKVEFKFIALPSKQRGKFLSIHFN